MADDRTPAQRDRDIENKRAKTERLRGQIAEERSKQSDAEALARRKIEAAQLDAEIATLEVQLAEEKALTKHAQDNAQAVIDAADEQTEAANVQKDAGPGPVDVNAGQGK